MNLLIVDDEKNIRESLCHLINWGELGIKHVKTARHGLDALSILETYEPHILLSDVRMPKMNGIELAQQVHTSHPKCKIIFLSGYADKDYLKSAITLQALDYIEKPVDKNAITQTVTKAVKQINDETKAAKSQDQLTSFFQTHRQIAVEKILHRLLSLDEPLHKTNALLSTLNIDLLRNHTFTLLDISPLHDSFSENRDTFIKALKASAFPRFIATCQSQSGGILIFISGQVKNKEDLVLQEINSLLHHLTPQRPYLLLITPPLTGHHRLATVYHQLKTLYYLAFYYHETTSVFMDTHYSQPFSLSTRDRNDFNDALKKQNLPLAKKYIEKFMVRATYHLDPDIEHIRNELSILYNLLLKKSFHHKGRDLSQLTQLKDLQEALISGLHQQQPALPLELEQCSRRTSNIYFYIKEHLSNPHLTLKGIADHIYLSESYLCASFKKEVGKTLKQYITEMRIAEACYLLDTTNKKLYEIALLVGFTDANYFSTLFKKQTQLTPSAYKERGSSL